MATSIQKPILGKLDQGTIFTCAAAEDYPGCRVHGLIITARCDVERERAPVINYLPVVALDDWIQRDGTRLLMYRVRQAAFGSMASVLKRLGLAATILETETPQAVFEKLLAGLPDAKHKRDKEQFLNEAGTLTLVSQEASLPNLGLTRELSQRFDGLACSIATDLTRQDLNGYYFLPRVEPDGSLLGHVALLREVRHIPKGLSQRVAAGLNHDEYQQACRDAPTLSGRLIYAGADFSCPIGQVQSPRLEHLMQAFTMLFGRIGVDDPDPAHGRNSWHMQPSLKGES